MQATRSPCRIITVAMALALVDRRARGGLTSGQLSYDGSQRVGEGGADDNIGEADLLPSPLDFLGGGRRVIRKYGQRVGCAKRSRVGVGGSHERRDRVADNRHVECELNVADGAEVACQPRDFDPSLTRQLYEGDRICDFGRQRLGLRTAYGHRYRRVKAGAADMSQPCDGLTHPVSPPARWGPWQAQS